MRMMTTTIQKSHQRLLRAPLADFTAVSVCFNLMQTT